MGTRADNWLYIQVAECTWDGLKQDLRVWVHQSPKWLLSRDNIEIYSEWSCHAVQNQYLARIFLLLPGFRETKDVGMQHILVFYIVHLGIQDLNKYPMVYQKAMVPDEVKVLYKPLAENTLPWGGTSGSLPQPWCSWRCTADGNQQTRELAGTENPRTGGYQRTQGLAGTREPEDWLGYLR